MRSKSIVAVDLFCGAGGLTRGLLDSGVQVVAGYDVDEACKYSYEHNNKPATFVMESIVSLTGKQLEVLYPRGSWKVLVGCAPCQPFSRYANSSKSRAKEWSLLRHFARLVEELRPDVVSMENLIELERHKVYDDFSRALADLNYEVSAHKVYCPDYGIPQHRTRLVVFASRLGTMSLPPPSHSPGNYNTVRDAISGLTPLQAGEVCHVDSLHRCSALSGLNLRRIKHSKAGGTWRDWPKDLISKCHQRKRGSTYPSVYGRLEWDRPSSTITTQFYGYGNGRFGHPVQNRALSLREGAILQTFPERYQFVKPGSPHHFKTIGKLIGNAVPVRLGTIVGKTIVHHLNTISK